MLRLLFWPDRHAGAIGPLSLNDALFWMNVHVELLAIDNDALSHIRGLGGVSTCSGAHRSDLHLIAAEVERASKRLIYWEHVVDTLQSRRGFDSRNRCGEPSILNVFPYMD